MKVAQRVALATTALTFVLVAVGVYVKITGSGLGCPDWPTCHGGAIPPNEREALIEFSHRFTAMLVGFLVIATAILAWKFYRDVPVAFWAAMIAVPLVGIQGLLGALTVVTELPPAIVATHLVTAMLVLSCEATALLAMYVEDPDRRAKFTPSAEQREAALGLAKRGLFVLAVLVPVVWIGGYMSESGASTACEGWPLCNGGVLPASDDQEITHMLHRYIAGATIFVIVPFVMYAMKHRTTLPWATGVAHGALSLYILQVFLGALNVWMEFPDLLTISHTVVAAGVWFAVSCGVILGLYQPVPRHATEASRMESTGAPA